MNGEARRIKLFRQLSSRLGAYKPELQGQYVCPLCGTGGFTKKSVLGSQPALTEEHCIPRELGKVVTVLTCAPCNNTGGSMIDQHLYKRLRFESFCKATQEEPVRARMTCEGQSLGIEVKRTGGDKPRMDIRIIAEQSDPTSVAAAQEKMAALAQQGVVNPMQMHFGPAVIPDNRKALTAALKSAYLLLFKKVGFPPVFSPLYDPVRQQIRDAKSSAVALDSIALRVPLEALPPSLSVVTSPAFGGLAVPVPLEKWDVGYTVIMPTDEHTYRRWAEWYELNKQANVSEFNLSFVTWDALRQEMADELQPRDSSDSLPAAPG